MRCLRRPLLALSLGAVLLVGACSSGSSSGSSTGTAVGSKAGTGTKAGAGTKAGGLPADFDICTAVPLAQIASITGQVFDDAEPDNTPSYQLFACNYTSTKALTQLRLDVIGGAGGPAGYDADVQALTATGHAQTTIDGLGDKAFYAGIAGGIGQYDALFGSNLIHITGATSVSIDQAKQIISALAAKLGS